MKLVYKAFALFVLLLNGHPILFANDKSIAIDELTIKADSFLNIAVYDSAIFYYQKSSLQSSNQNDYLDKLIKIATIYRIKRDFDSVQIYIERIEGYRRS